MHDEEKVDNFVIVLIGLIGKQWDFMLKTTQWNIHVINTKGYDIVIVHSHFSVHLHVNQYYM